MVSTFGSFAASPLPSRYVANGGEGPHSDDAAWSQRAQRVLRRSNTCVRDVTLVGEDTGGAIVQLVLAGDHGRVGSVVLTNCDATGPAWARRCAPAVVRQPRIEGWRRLLAAGTLDVGAPKPAIDQESSCRRTTPESPT